MKLAITRAISPRFNECELTHIDRAPIDLERAKAQHGAYIRALQELGCAVIELSAEPNLPDSVFVEDAAIVLPEVAVITRLGADSRKPETESISKALRPYRDLLYITKPATLDGGDVLVIGKTIYVGLSTRSTLDAVEQLTEQLRPYGYVVQGVTVTDCLHLKSAVTRIDDNTVLLNPKWVDPHLFAAYRVIDVAEDEPHAANVLPVDGALILPTAFPNTAARLKEHGYRLCQVDVAELAKAEGAVTCCSVLFDA